jgi:8-oxo-dGTP diphosphatase
MTEAPPSNVQRVGAYALCVQDDQILLSRFSPPDCRWGPPGGGVEHGESPAAAVVREVAEETGLDVEVGRVVNVYSNVWGRDPIVHAISIVFEVSVVGGELRGESDGSSDQVRWVLVDRLADTKTTGLLDALLSSTSQ